MHEKGWADHILACHPSPEYLFLRARWIISASSGNSTPHLLHTRQE